MRYSVRVVVFLFAFFFAPLLGLSHRSAAQGSATLSGSVSDPGGAAVSGAQVSVQPEPSAGASQRVSTGADGRFALQSG